MFPKSFELSVYKTYSDLKYLNDIDLINHYNNFGKEEGRISSLISSRDSLKNFINTNIYDCLEIGPFDCPVLIGEKVKYFDVLNKANLKIKAIKAQRPHPINNIPIIDYVDPNGNLQIINDTFDIILSCHSIEHQLDFIQHLNDVSKLLNPNGHYVIIVPDKRYCFDHFIKESTISDILQQHLIKNKFHSLKSVIEHRALTCHNDGIRHWNNDHGNQNYMDNPHIISNAIDEFNRYAKNKEYLDVHSLQFTPDSFKNIIEILNKLNYIDLTIDVIYPTIKNSCEFYVILKK